MQQLAIPTPVTLPTELTYRTQTSETTLSHYQQGHCWQQTSDGQPFMETHLVYLKQEYIGQINRAFPDTPWRIACCGVPDSKTHGFDFDAAVSALVNWYQQEQQNSLQWITDFASKTIAS